MAKDYTHVIWDWNGTLLDDVGWCVQVVNTLLTKRNLPALEDVDAYRRVFGFPVIDYYRRLGFDFEKEPFEILAAEYIELYHSDARKFHLFPDAEATLVAVRGKGLHQIILSASELGNLLSQVRPFNIEQYFDDILGISDIYAKSKVEAGRAYMERANIGKAVLIGDTAHDCEVAKALGADCLLVARGHQSKAALLSRRVPVVDDLLDVRRVLQC